MLRSISVSILAALLAALLAVSCAPKRAPVYQPAAPAPEAAVAPQPAPERERAKMQAIEERLSRQDYTGAAVLLSEFVAAYPGSVFVPVARLKLAFAYVRLGYFDAAAQLLRTGSPESLRRVEVQLLLSEAEEGAGRDREAFIAAEEALRRAGERPVLRTCQERLKALGAKLGPEDAGELGQRFREGYAAGVLRYRQAQLAALSGRADVALELLETFERDFPGHDLTSDAWALRRQIERGEIAVPPAPAELSNTIGVLVPQEGGFRAVGEQVLKGLELAAGIFTEPSEGAGPSFRLAVRGCGMSGEAAAASLRELVEDEGALAVVALLGPAHAEAVGHEAQELRVPLLALSQDRRLPTGGFVFRNFITPQAQVERLAAFAAEGGFLRLAIFYPQDAYGREMAELMATVAPLYGLEVVAEASYDPARSNVIESIKQLLPEEEARQPEEELAEEAGGEAADLEEEGEESFAEAPEEGAEPAEELPFEAVFVPESAMKALIVLPQFAYADVRGVTFLGPNLWNDPRFAKGLEEFHAEVYFVDAFHPGTPELAVQSFVAAYRRMFDEDPGYVAAQSFDDAQMVISALDAGAQGREGLAAALARMDYFEGATGLTSLDVMGEAEKSLQVLTVRYRRIRRAE